ncbi:MAG: preprotein translocase subunit SecG [candidate division Zixibacteria bacterium RBG_16_50_21]|nr:MAG: preprotein translocase subunit SecG [candidate division Zixibacteria bacterium RBG_16_50_21]
MFGIFILIHVIISTALILVILMQSAKGEGLAGAFGGSGITGAVFGGRGAATFLSRATTVLAIAFFVSCLVLTVLFPSGGVASRQSTVQREAQKAMQQQQTPATDQSGTQPAPSQTEASPGSVLPPVPDTGGK